MAFEYITDADFSELRDRDETTELIGYVDEVHAPAVVGSKSKYDLFKFVLNNGSSKRIVCLVWGKSVIQKHEGDIVIGRILHIEGAYTKAVSMNYYKETNKYVPFELLIKDSTILNNLGTHQLNANADKLLPQEVTFKTIGKVQGLIAIEGYIKMKFVKAKNKFNNEVYGCGAITDGNYKVTVHVANYTEMDLEKGVFVKVIGEIEKLGGPVVIMCRDANSITPVENTEPMTLTQLARGLKTPKRGLE